METLDGGEVVQGAERLELLERLRRVALLGHLLAQRSDLGLELLVLLADRAVVHGPSQEAADRSDDSIHPRADGREGVGGD